MKRSMKRLLVLGLAGCLSLSSALVALADEYAVSRNSGDFYFNCIFSPDGSLEDSGITMSIEDDYGTGNLYYVSDETLTMTIDGEKTVGLADWVNPYVQWGCIDGDTYIGLGVFEPDGMAQYDKAYPVIPPEQLAKDIADGTAYNKTYVLEFQVLKEDFGMEFFAYFFQLKQDS